MQGSPPSIKTRLAQTTLRTESPHRLLRLLPRGNRFPPELLTLGTSTTLVHHRDGLLGIEKATSLPDAPRRLRSGRLRFRRVVDHPFNLQVSRSARQHLDR